MYFSYSAAFQSDYLSIHREYLTLLTSSKFISSNLSCETSLLLYNTAIRCVFKLECFVYGLIYHPKSVRSRGNISLFYVKFSRLITNKHEVFLILDFRRVLNVVNFL